MKRLLCVIAAAFGLAALIMFAAPVRGDETQPAKGALKQELVDRWKNMTPAEREKMRERFQQWKAMTPEEKQKVLKNMERFQKLTPEQRQKLMEARHRWEQQPPEARQKMHREFERFKQLPPEVRQRIMERMAFTREQMKGDFEALKTAAPETHEALRKDIHRKLRALMELKGEQFEEFRKMPPEERAAKLKELMDNLPPETHVGHPGFGPHRRGPENAKPEEQKTEPAPAPTPAPTTAPAN